MRQKPLFSGLDCQPGQTDGDALPAPARPAPDAFTCPAGHRVEWDHKSGDTAPTCHTCDLIATHYNAREFKVFEWTPVAVHEDACRRLQDEMDAAFDHQYFGEW